MARVFVTRELPGTALERLASAHEVRVRSGEGPPSRGELLEAVAETDALLCLLTERVDAELLDAAPELSAVANLAVGTDNIDLAECERRGIAVANTPDILVEATADLAFGLLLAAARGLVDAAADVRAGRWRTWEPAGWLGRSVGGATIGIVGTGKIGTAVARRAEGFGMEVLSTSRSGGTPLKELLERADFVSLHCPLTEETRGLIGAPELERMKPTAILINTARGEIVETEALRVALADGLIAGAALDVTDPEPLGADHPLLDAPNLLVVPHIGSATHQAREAMADLAVDNLLAALAGRAVPNRVSAGDTV